MAWLFRKIFWFTLFLIATFAFVVLFEHGTQNYMQSAQGEFEKLRKMMGARIDRPKDHSDKVGQ